MSWGLNQLTCRVPLGDMLRFYQSHLINLIRPTSFFLRLSITDFRVEVISVVLGTPTRMRKRRTRIPDFFPAFEHRAVSDLGIRLIGCF